MTFRSLLIQTIAGLLIFLLVYAALSKLFDLQSFRATLQRSPLIGALAPLVAITIPLLELLISFLLLIPRTRTAGLLSAFLLMLLFSGYIACLLLFKSHLPCSCGGVLKSLSWKEHLVFNLLFTLLALMGYFFEKRQADNSGWERSEA